MRLKDTVALVTGAASGIGRATALLFGQEGAQVMCADIEAEGAERTARQIADSGGEAASVHVDVAEAADAERFTILILNLFMNMPAVQNRSNFAFR